MRQDKNLVIISTDDDKEDPDLVKQRLNLLTAIWRLSKPALTSPVLFTPYSGLGK